MVYCSERHSSEGINILQLAKEDTRIMMGCRCRDPCRKLLFNLETLPLPSQYILSPLLFMIRTKNQLMVSSEIYHIDTRQYANFHQLFVNLTKYQKGMYCLSDLGI
jgi:hypothetical protein